MRTALLYPMDIDYAYEIAECLDLPSSTTIIQPSNLVGFLCATETDAVLFKLHFNDAKRWPSHDPEIFLMATPASDELRDWSEENRDRGQLLELVAIEFGSISDQNRFEAAR